MSKVNFGDVLDLIIDKVWPLACFLFGLFGTFIPPAIAFSKNIHGEIILAYTPIMGIIVGVSFFLFTELYFILFNKHIKNSGDYGSSYNGITLPGLVLVKIVCITWAAPSAYIMYALYCGFIGTLPFMKYILMGVGVIVLFVLINMGIAKKIYEDKDNE